MFVPLTGGLGGRLRNSPSAAPRRREPRKAPAESRRGEQSPESRGWVRRARRSPPGSPLWAMLSEPRWKSLELLIINSCMRERTHTHRCTHRHPRRPPNIPSARDGHRGSHSYTHTHVLHKAGRGARRPPWGRVGGSPAWTGARTARLRLPLLGSAGEGVRLFLQRPGFWGGGVPPPFPATETRQRPCKRELK